MSSRMRWRRILGDINLFEDRENPYVEKKDGFLDFECESASVGSADEIRQFDCQSFLSAQEEFSDASEDFSSDDSVVNSPSYNQSVESELRLSLFEEIERPKNAEEALNLMQSHWQRFNNILPKAGLTSPTSSTSGRMPYENASIEEVCQEGIVTRFVAEAAELAAELILESKDQEISRLRDRLQYYKAMNPEMSQRNIEIVEIARKQRQKIKTGRRWFWSCIGLSIAVGISVLGCSYLPSTSTHLSSSDISDASKLFRSCSGILPW